MNIVTDCGTTISFSWCWGTRGVSATLLWWNAFGLFDGERDLCLSGLDIQKAQVSATVFYKRDYEPALN
jgi:hypothetical protein